MSIGAAIIYWLPLAAFAGLFVLGEIIHRRVLAPVESFANLKAFEARLEARIELLDEKAAELRKAVTLLSCGAKEEAAQILDQWEVPADG